MKISTKGRYGLKAMVDLAINSAGGQVTLKSIAERQNISEGYLEQVFSLLRKAELVISVKGSQGGYSLSRDASSISVGEILRALEGTLSVIDEKNEDSNNQIDYCIKCNVWDKMNDSINKTVDSITLDNLAEDYKKLTDMSSFIYYI